MAVPVRYVGQLLRGENEHGGSACSRTTGILRPGFSVLVLRCALLWAVNVAGAVVVMTMGVRSIDPLDFRMESAVGVSKAWSQTPGDHHRRSDHKDESSAHPKHQLPFVDRNYTPEGYLGKDGIVKLHRTYHHTSGLLLGFSQPKIVRQ